MARKAEPDYVENYRKGEGDKKEKKIPFLMDMIADPALLASH